jgi:rfaE bifunctional protein nucleotidyltransferase chain/domain
MGRLVSRKTAGRIAAGERRRGSKIVFTNGCFDILHAGHVSLLRRARSLGDLLVVGLNSDRSIRALKGRGRPIVPERDRAEVLCGLSSVDYVVLFGEKTASRLIETLRPDVYVKGGDNRVPTIPETPSVRRVGGVVRVLPFREGRSTTAIVERIRRTVR